MDESYKITDIVHPDYRNMTQKWSRFRSIMRGGSKFIEDWVVKFSEREDPADFEDRKKITPCPSHAKAAMVDVKNAVYQRMIDITRSGGPKSYIDAIKGENGGVDLNGNTMNGFIGRLILGELLIMKRVGVYVDKNPQSPNASRAQTKDNRPYIYYYTAENIRSWAYGPSNQLITLLLRDTDYVLDEKYGLIKDTESSYRLLRVNEKGVLITFYDTNGEETSKKQLTIKEIPFVMFELSESLLNDVANHQIALVNLSSSDVNYGLKSNFPFYTEQYNPMSDMATAMRKAEDTGTAEDAAAANPNEINIGAAQGRKYPVGTERPDFIHPSPEPLRVSMEKQDRLAKEIRQLVNLTISNLEPQHTSSAIQQGDKSLEAGLSYIGLELEYGERQIGKFWAMYEGNSQSITINYPQSYSLQTDDERLDRAEKLRKLIPIIPSKTYQKAIAKEIATITVGHKVNNKDMSSINNEINDAAVIVTDPEVIKTDIEGGLVSEKLASKLRGYPDGEVDQAREDHALRAARIALAQSRSGARGVKDLDEEEASKSAKSEKELSQDDTLDSKKADKTRGKAQ